MAERIAERAVIENVQPQIDGGRFPIKRTAGEEVVVTADIYGDGHDVLAAVLQFRPPGALVWQEVALEGLGDDRWSGRFRVTALGRYEFGVQAWVDHFASWRKELSKKVAAGIDVTSELLEGAELVAHGARRANGADVRRLQAAADELARGGDAVPRLQTALDRELAVLMGQYPDRSRATSLERVCSVVVERPRALCGAWYEIFPRSCAREPGRHGTFRDCEARLPDIAAMGFDVLYLPPIHPIGRSFRKGPNNSPDVKPGDPGSPWAIGTREGGHKAVHPELGTLQDFEHLVAAAQQHGLEIALDLAFQCSPDHPYVQAHPEWFHHRPDGSIKYAENPPKKYEDIYPLDFECAGWQGLWDELKSVVFFWMEHGVRIFRVDNPHTKPFSFWEWLLQEVRDRDPEVIFLSEAFTRPKVMRRLAKGGFSQSYTYYTWRNTKAELTEYFTELMHTTTREQLRPNLFANTPDILHEYLQFGGRPAFQSRLVLAATLAASYGIYGPAYELCETRAVRGTEDYQDSEKYQLRLWDYDRPENLRDFVTRVNQIRRENAALQQNWNLRFYAIDNEQMIFYGKSAPDLSNFILVVVNLDPHHVQSGTAQVPLAELGLEPRAPYQVHDLLSDARYLWQGEANFVRLDPAVCPAHILRLRRKIKTERDFDYYV